MTEPSTIQSGRDSGSSPTISFCTRCGGPWNPAAQSCDGCGLELADLRPLRAPPNETASMRMPSAAPSTRNPLLVLNVVTLVAVLATAALLLLQMDGLNGRVSSLEAAIPPPADTSGIESSMSQMGSDIGRLQSSISDLQSTVSAMSTTLDSRDYSSQLDQLSTDISAVKDQVDSICLAVPNC